MFRKNNLFTARLPRISANWNENYRPHNFQALSNISGNIKFPENLQAYTVPFEERRLRPRHIRIPTPDPDE